MGQNEKKEQGKKVKEQGRIHGTRCAQYAYFSPSKITRDLRADLRTDTTSYRDTTAHQKRRELDMWRPNNGGNSNPRLLSLGSVSVFRSSSLVCRIRALSLSRYFFIEHRLKYLCFPPLLSTQITSVHRRDFLSPQSPQHVAEVHQPSGALSSDTFFSPNQ